MLTATGQQQSLASSEKSKPSRDNLSSKRKKISDAEFKKQPDTQTPLSQRKLTKTDTQKGATLELVDRTVDKEEPNDDAERQLSTTQLRKSDLTPPLPNSVKVFTTDGNANVDQSEQPNSTQPVTPPLEVNQSQVLQVIACQITATEGKSQEALSMNKRNGSDLHGV